MSRFKDDRKQKVSRPDPLPDRITLRAEPHAAARGVDGVRSSESGNPGPSVQERIERLAYLLYEQRGGDPGDPVEDWLEAERRVKALEAAPRSAPEALRPGAVPPQTQNALDIRLKTNLPRQTVRGGS